MLHRRLLSVLLLGAGLWAGPAFGQGTPTGGVSGKVFDPDGLALPGVTIAAASPALQGVRTAVSSDNGDYIIPFLPPGMYTLLCFFPSPDGAPHIAGGMVAPFEVLAPAE